MSINYFVTNPYFTDFPFNLHLDFINITYYYQMIRSLNEHMIRDSVPVVTTNDDNDLLMIVSWPGIYPPTNS